MILIYYKITYIIKDFNIDFNNILKIYININIYFNYNKI